MFGSGIIDIAIGLILIYVVLSLVVTSVNELLATLSRSRARDLERGIRNLLDGKSDVPERWWGPIVRSFRKKPKPTALGWSQAFFEHQLIYALSKDEERPSYIPSQTFATVLLHLVQRSASAGNLLPHDPPPEGQPLNGSLDFNLIHEAVEKINNPFLKHALLPLVETARSEAATGVAAVKGFSDQVQKWYDTAMDRVGGWYRRRTQLFLLSIALVTTVALNVDTIEIGRRLGTDAALRAALVEKAKGVSLPTPSAGSASSDGSVAEVKKALDQLDGLGIPLGWNLPESGKSKKFADYWNDLREQDAPIIVTKVMGLLLTVFAVSLGAPFWFDMLNKLVSLRGAGKPPEKKAAAP